MCPLATMHLHLRTRGQREAGSRAKDDGRGTRGVYRIQMGSVNTITLRSPAKINLCLSVLGRRPDGYHDVEMLMQMVGVYDEVCVSPAGTGIALSCDAGSVPGGPANIAWKAADALLKRSGSQQGVTITIKKAIPVAAGLGGGSSDAAAVLTAMNILLG